MSPESIPEMTQKVMDRLRKLLNKATSAREIGSVPEAEAFAAKARELLEKYKLDMSEVSLEEQEKEEPVGYGETVTPKHAKAKPENWSSDLAWYVAAHFCCRILVFQKSNKVLLVGRPTDRAICAYVIERLLHFGEDECGRQFWRERGRRQRATGSWAMPNWKASWYLGYVTALRDRFAEQTRATSTGVALVLRKSTEAVDLFIAERCKPSKKKAKRQAPRRKGALDGGAFDLGTDAGQKPSLTANGIGEGSPRDNFKALS